MAINPKTLTRAELAATVYQEIGLSLAESSALVDSVFEQVIECFEHGESVKLSSFGAFAVRLKKKRIGRNPKTGIEVPISPRKVLTFNASNILKNRVNSGKKA